MRTTQRVLLSSLVITLAAVSIPRAASAEGSQRSARTYNRSGPYIGIAGGWGRTLFESDLDSALDRASSSTFDIPISTKVDDSFTIDVFTGYRLFTFLAVEVQYEHLFELEIEAVNRAPGPQFGATSRADLAGHTLTLNTKWILPLWRVQPYAILGVGFVHYDVKKKGDIDANVAALELLDSVTGVAGRLGTGIDFYVTRNWVVSASSSFVLTDKRLRSEFDRAISADGLHYVSVNAGVQYRF